MSGVSDSDSEPVVRFSELEARKLSARLADAITDTILKHGLQPGARLPSEREMREQFGVGRGTLREALRVLETEGLITVRSGPRGGPVVAQPDANRLSRLLILLLLGQGATLRHVYDVRVVLEPLVAAEAARHGTDGQVEELAASVRRIKDVVGDEAALVAENQTFHRVLAEASGNPVMVAFSLSLLMIFDGYEMGTHFEPSVRAEVVKVHMAIARGVAAHDAEKARRASRRHIDGSIRFLTQRYPDLLDEPLRPTLLTV